MSTPDREDIHLISQHAPWTAQGARKALEEHVHNDKTAWQKFLELLFLGAGVGFLAAGIIFFFAYNWQSLHKFVKIGLMEGLLIVLVLATAFSKLKPIVKQVLVTGAAVMVGVLLAVFGQVYQTGADAYDLFLSWTVGVTVWVLAFNFPPLWLIYLALVNITVLTYSEQVAHWVEGTIYPILLLINAGFVVVNIVLSRWKAALTMPDWLLYVVTLGALAFSTIGIVIGIVDRMDRLAFAVLLIASVVLYAGGIIYGLLEKKLFYLAVIPLSAIIIVTSFILRQSIEAGTILFTCLFIIVSVTLLIRWLISLQKNIAHEKSA